MSDLIYSSEVNAVINVSKWLSQHGVSLVRHLRSVVGLTPWVEVESMLLIQKLRTMQKDRRITQAHALNMPPEKQAAMNCKAIVCVTT